MLKFWKDVNFLFLFIRIYFLIINLHIHFENFQTYKKKNIINTHVHSLRNSTYTAKAPSTQLPEHLLCTTCLRNTQILSLILFSCVLQVILYTHIILSNIQYCFVCFKTLYKWHHMVYSTFVELAFFT